MATGLAVFLFATGAVALFVVGMSLTLIIKGRHMDSEISTNPHMRARGIKCAVQEAREARLQEQGDDCTTVGCSGNCAACDDPVRK